MVRKRSLCRPMMSHALLILTCAALFCLPARTAAQANPGEWAWMGGSDVPTSTPLAPTYGTEYQFAPSNQPGSRQMARSWTDKAGRMWLFGGYVSNAANDLWVFDPAQGASGEWAWMGGNQAGSCDLMDNGECPGIYGVKYQFADSNIPGSRDASVSWLDQSGRLWIFGGYGRDSVNTEGALNDLWVFDPAQGAHGQWAWMGGSKLAGGGHVAGTEYQFAPDNSPGGHYYPVGWTDKSGRLWLFGGVSMSDGSGALLNSNDLWVFDPAQGAHGEWAWMGGLLNPESLSRGGTYGTEYQFDPANWPSVRNLALTWTDAAGKLWLFGGGGDTSLGNTSVLNDLWVFDPSLGAHGEWAWMGGSSTVIEPPGVYGSKYQFAPDNTPGGRDSAFGWTDATGRFWLFGGFGSDAYGTPDAKHVGQLDDLWVFDPAQGAHGEWAWMGGHKALVCYSRFCDSSWPPVAQSPYAFVPANTPGGRNAGNAWTDSSGNLWLLGGTTFTTTSLYVSDLWEFRFFTPQTITFSPLPFPLTYGAGPISLSATSSSGLPVAYKLVAGPGQLSLGPTNTTLLTITGSGAAVVINAYQDGDSEFAPAAYVQQGRWIRQAPLTVTADNKTMTYGQPVPALTWTPTGFVNGDTAAYVLTGTPTLSTSVTSTSLPGTYPIRIDRNTLAAPNYIVTPKWGAITVQPLGTVRDPIFRPAAGTYQGSQSVRILDATATVYYTTDGSTPSSTHGTKYTGPITVSASGTINAIAVKAGYTPSAVISATYTIQ